MTRSAQGRIDAIVGNNIRSMRMAKGLSQSDLGNMIGLTFQQIQKYESATNTPATGRIRQICKVLGVSPDQLFSATPNGHDPLPQMSAWAVRLAFRLDSLPTGVRGAISQLIDGLIEAKN